jgi:hypothetical protein
MDRRHAKQLVQALEAIESGEETAHDYLSQDPEVSLTFLLFLRLLSSTKTTQPLLLESVSGMQLVRASLHL